METLLVILSIAAIALLIAAYFPDTAVTVYSGYERLKKFLVPVVVVFGAFILLGTGLWQAVAVGTAMIVLFVWGVYFSDDVSLGV